MLDRRAFNAGLGAAVLGTAINKPTFAKSPILAPTS